MCRGMPVNFERLGIAISQQPKVDVFFQRPGQVNEIAMRLSYKRGIGKTLADRFGDIERGSPSGDFFHGPVGKLDMDAVCHRLGSMWSVFSLLEGAGWVKRMARCYRFMTLKRAVQASCSVS